MTQPERPGLSPLSLIGIAVAALLLIGGLWFLIAPADDDAELLAGRVAPPVGPDRVVVDDEGVEPFDAPEPVDATVVVTDDDRAEPRPPRPRGEVIPAGEAPDVTSAIHPDAATGSPLREGPGDDDEIESGPVSQDVLEGIEEQSDRLPNGG